MKAAVKIFRWTDVLVERFAKATTAEVYGIFKGKKTMKEKLLHFKKLHTTNG